MARKRRNSESGGDTWMNTYADMVTLLLTFFAVLLSMSNIDKEKFDALIQSFSGLPPESIQEVIGSGQGGSGTGDSTVQNSMEQLYQSLKSYVDHNNQSEAVEITKIDEVIYIRFNSAVFFEPDRYALRTDAYQTMSFIGDGLKQFESDIRLVNICGHTADPPGGGSKEISSWMLSGERAAIVAMYLEEQKQFDPQKLIVMGYSDNFPAADNTTEQGMRQNRRVELVIIGKESDVTFDVYDTLGPLYDKEKYPTAGGANELLIPPASSKSVGTK